MIKSLVLDKNDNITILKYDDNHFLCSMCGGYFHIKKSYKSVKYRCKECQQFDRQCNYLLNQEKIKKQVKNYDNENIEQFKLRQKRYRMQHKDRLTSYFKNYQKDLYKNDKLFKLSQLLRRRTRGALKSKKFKKNKKFKEYIGCSIKELADHLEKQFKVGMSWDNHGEWHIDHIIPLSSAENEAEIYKLSHYTNLQPLWAAENMTKGAKIK